MPTNETNQQHQALRAEVRSKISHISGEKIGYVSMFIALVERYRDCWTPDEELIVQLLITYSVNRLTENSIGRDLEEWRLNLRDTERVAKEWQERTARLKKEAA